MMNRPPPINLTEIFAGALGVAAAVLLLGGWILLRLQQSRQQFAITRGAY